MDRGIKSAFVLLAALCLHTLLACGASGASLSASPDTVAAGGAVTAAWSGIVTPTPKDWVGLYKPGAVDRLYIQYKYTNGQASGSLSLPLPTSLAPGLYELRLFPNNLYTPLATSNSFTVTAPPLPPPPATLSVSPTSLPAGATLTATWNGIATPASHDWIGLYASGAADTTYKSFQYTGGGARGSLTFTAPSVAGTYELRLFKQGGYTRLAVSNSFTVTAPPPPPSVPALTVSPSALAFGSQNVGTTSAAQTLTVKNTGTANLTIGSVSLGGANPGDFSFGPDLNGAVIAPNATRTVSVSFTPGAAGTRSASLAFASNAAVSPARVSLSGTGITPAPQLGTASIEIIPAQPTTSDSISIRIFGTWPNSCVPRNPAASTAGSQIVIATANPSPICSEVLTNWSLTVSVGFLSAGTYQVIVVHNGSEIGRRSFTVTPAVVINLAITKTVDKATAAPGDGLRYVISFQNNGSQSVSGTVITDTIPTGTQLLDTSPTVTPSGSLLTWRPGTLNPGQGDSVVVRVLVNPGAGNGTQVSNQATIAVPAQQFTRNSNTVTTEVTAPPSGNLLVNGSFEEPVVPDGNGWLTFGPDVLPGWRVTQGTVDVVHSRYWQPAPGQGSQSLDLVGSPGAGTIEQTFPTQPGRLYDFSGWLSHSPLVSEGRAGIFLSGQLLVELHATQSTSFEDMQWTRFSYRFQAAAASTTLTISDVTGQSDYSGTALDGLEITLAVSPAPPPPPPPPPPSTLTVAQTSVQAGGSVTAVWSSIPSPAPDDWIGLYHSGETDDRHLLRYQNTNSTAPNGSMSFALPANLVAPGSYELRLFSKGAYTRLATSNSFAVTTPSPGPTPSPAPKPSSFAGTWSAQPPTDHAVALTVDNENRFTVWAVSGDRQTVARSAQGTLNADGSFEVTSTDGLVRFTGQVAADRQSAAITATRPGFLSFTITAPRLPDINQLPSTLVGTFHGSATAANGDRLDLEMSIDPGGNCTLYTGMIQAGLSLLRQQFGTLFVTADGRLTDPDGSREVGLLQVSGNSLMLTYNFLQSGYQNIFQGPLQR